MDDFEKAATALAKKAADAPKSEDAMRFAQAASNLANAAATLSCKRKPDHAQ